MVGFGEVGSSLRFLKGGEAVGAKDRLSGMAERGSGNPGSFLVRVDRSGVPCFLTLAALESDCLVAVEAAMRWDLVIVSR